MRLISIRYIQFKKKFKTLKKAVVWGTEMDFQDSFLIFVVCVVIISFREVTAKSISVSDDKRFLRS